MVGQASRGAQADPIQRWAWRAIGLNVALGMVHALVAARSGSLAVAAELAHNGADLVSAVVVLVGVKVATRTTPRFPYGLHKVEDLVAVGIAAMVFVTAYEIVRRAVTSGSDLADVDAWMIAVVAITTVVPLVFSRFELRVAAEEGSPALAAQAREYRVHVATTGLVLVSLLANRIDLPIDRVAAVVIAAAVAKTGWDLLSNGMRVLLDAGLDRSTIAEIEQAIATDVAVSEVPWVTSRNAGRFRFVEAGVSLRVTDLAAAEAALRRIEGRVREAVPHVDRVVLQVEPVSSPHRRCAVPLADRDGAVSEHFGQAPCFAVVLVDRADGTRLDEQVLDNPHLAVERGKGMRVAEWLVSLGVDVVVAREPLDGRGPGHVLGEAGIEVRVTDAASLAGALDALRPDGGA